MTTSNLLNISDVRQHDFSLTFDQKSGGIQGVILLLMDQRFDGIASANIWHAITSINAANDGITYVIRTARGGSQLVYVGKTLNTMAKRYPNGPAGGLKLVFDLYDKGNAMMDVTLYNNSHPSLVEGWCYQVAVSLKLNLANVQDPS